MTWCHVPGTDCPSAQAAEAWIWASCLPNPASTPDALSSGKNTLDQPSSQPSGPDTSPQPRYGTISQPLTPSPLQGQLTPCWLAILVSRSAKLGSASGQTIRATSGPTSPASSVSLAMDCAGSSSKTSLATSPLAQKPCCESYWKWAGRLRLAHSRRLKLVRRMKGSGGSAWPTINTQDARGAGSARTRDEGKQAMLHDMAAKWPSPQARDHRSGDSPDSPRQARKAETGWSQNLNDVAEMGTWPTPSAAQDTKGAQADAAAVLDRMGRHQIGLADTSLVFSRPDPETVPHGPLSWPQALIVRHLLRAAISLPPRSISRPHSPPTRRKPLNPHYAAYREARAWERWSAKRLHWWSKRRLSPAFVTWLMGWPSGHALCACSATEFALWQRQMRGALSALPMASGPWIWKPSVDGKPQIQEEMDI